MKQTLNKTKDSELRETFEKLDDIVWKKPNAPQQSPREMLFEAKRQNAKSL